jgi:hypothetical protein
MPTDWKKLKGLLSNINTRPQSRDLPIMKQMYQRGIII